MSSPRMILRFVSALAIVFLSAAAVHAQPEGTVNSLRYEGIMITTLAQPEFFIFQSGTHEEHFDGSIDSLESQGGVEAAEPITGLHYIRAKLAVDGAAWSDADKKLLDAQFHGASTGNFYLFKTVEGQLFYLPKEGQTPVVRVDYLMANGRKVTVWTLK
ncbi:MAG: hypothetical protein ACAI37_14620 [Chthoniobacter sp.]